MPERLQESGYVCGSRAGSKCGACHDDITPVPEKTTSELWALAQEELAHERREDPDD